MPVSHETASQKFGTEMRERVRLPVDSKANGHTERFLIPQSPKNQEFHRVISAITDVWGNHGVLLGQSVCLKMSRSCGCASVPYRSHVTGEASWETVECPACSADMSSYLVDLRGIMLIV